MIKTQAALNLLQKETFFDTALMPFGASLMGPRLIETLTPQAFLLGSILNGLTLAITRCVLNQVFENKSFCQLVASIGAFTLVGIATPKITNQVSNWTGVILNCQEAVIISGLNFALKVTGYVFYKLLKTVAFPLRENIEEIKHLNSLQLQVLHFYYQKRPESLRETSLRFQVALNLRFFKSNYEIISETGFSNVGDGFNSEECSFLLQHLEKFSVEKKDVVSFFYKRSIRPEKGDFNQDDLATIPLHLGEKKAKKLSPQQLFWLHLAISKRDRGPTLPSVRPILAERFYACKFPVPEFRFEHQFFLDRPTVPSSLDPIHQEEEYQISWLYNYYLHYPDKWEKLSIEDQYRYNKAFIEVLDRPCALVPNEESLHAESAIIRALHKQYEECRGKWYELCPFLQKKLIKKFLEVDGRTDLKPFPVRVEDLTGLESGDIVCFHEFMKLDETLYVKMDGSTKRAFKKRCAEANLNFPPAPTPMYTQPIFIG